VICVFPQRPDISNLEKQLKGNSDTGSMFAKLEDKLSAFHETSITTGTALIVDFQTHSQSAIGAQPKVLCCSGFG
jgi:hypothetical protein